MDWHARFVQQARWTRDLRIHLFGRARLEQAKRVLEVGCGTGAIMIDMECQAGIFGLDLDPNRLTEAHLHAPEVRLVCGNGHCLPWLAATFDITFCHFLLLWMLDPLRGLREMKRVTRSGGAVLALAEPDYDNRVDKPAPLAPLGRWQAEALRRQGADPGLGKRLADLFQQAGIQLIETGVLRENESVTPSPEDRVMEWEVLETDLAGLVRRKEIQRMKKLDEQAWHNGERRLYVPMYFAYGLV